MAPTNVRALHYVLKVADRTATVHFLHDALGMRALRHEEFETGCKAACNGPFDGRWSKTMMGYASEVGRRSAGGGRLVRGGRGTGPGGRRSACSRR